ncbi:NAD(P)-binding protein [Phellopilus nigrolimitatus]|nr:NAD(P)-binding protein [Phellopilus nigrolimitatus]
MSIADIQRTFLSAPRFAVVGASKDETKFGTKVLKWYQARNFLVTPVHPVRRLQLSISFITQKEEELESLKTVRSLSELPAPSETAVSIITSPKVTLGILKSAKELGTVAIWLQPGADDDTVREYIEDNGLTDRVILGGPCILVEGDAIIGSLSKL